MAKPPDIPHAGRRLACAGMALALALVNCTPAKDGGKEASVNTQSIAGPEGSLHVDDCGKDGLAVVFVHGFAGSTDH